MDIIGPSIALEMANGGKLEAIGPPWTDPPKEVLRQRVRERAARVDQDDDRQRVHFESTADWVGKPSLVNMARAEAYELTIPDQLVTPLYRLTDAGNASRFSDHHRGHFVFTPKLGWLVWDGKRWALLDKEDKEVFRAAKATAAIIYKEAAAIRARAAEETDEDEQKRLLAMSNEVFKHAKRSESKAALEAMVKLAEAGEVEGVDLVRELEEFDRHDHLLNCANGTVNLRTGVLRPHNPRDLITQLVPIKYDPKAKCPKWLGTLKFAYNDDAELLAYIRRLHGYFATGSVDEKVLPIMVGEGDTLKTTILEVVRRALGEYARVAQPETFVSGSVLNKNNAEDMARLRPARLALLSETEDGDRLAVALLKRVTGGNVVTARHLYKSSFEYAPKFQPVLETNHPPQIPHGDDAIWNRVCVIPHTRRMPKRRIVKGFAAKLVAKEGPGILAYIVRGAREWYKDGLGESQVVRDATAKLRDTQDTLSEWLDQEAIDVPGGQFPRAYDSYQEWCKRNSKSPLSSNAFGTSMKKRGYMNKKPNVGPRYFEGIEPVDGPRAA